MRGVYRADPTPVTGAPMMPYHPRLSDASEPSPMSSPICIAMWSGPRNISTAMMRAWENRPDTTVWDEPLYASYLAHTGIDHPGRDAIIAAGEPDWRAVVARCLTPPDDGHAIFFQKHMTHHLLDEMDHDWLARVTNCFLIRDPREVIASYVRVRENPTLADVGVEQQARIVDHVQRVSGRLPIIVDSRDVLEAPRAMLEALCRALGVAFDPRMLSWPAGPRDSDGVWAPYWYHAVNESTGFAPYRPRNPELPAALEPIAARCTAHYQRLYAARLRADPGGA